MASPESVEDNSTAETIKAVLTPRGVTVVEALMTKLLAETVAVKGKLDN